MGLRLLSDVATRRSVVSTKRRRVTIPGLQRTTCVARAALRPGNPAKAELQMPQLIPANLTFCPWSSASSKRMSAGRIAAVAARTAARRLRIVSMRPTEVSVVSAGQASEHVSAQEGHGGSVENEAACDARSDCTARAGAGSSTTAPTAEAGPTPRAGLEPIPHAAMPTPETT